MCTGNSYVCISSTFIDMDIWIFIYPFSGQIHVKISMDKRPLVYKGQWWYIRNLQQCITPRGTEMVGYGQWIYFHLCLCVPTRKIQQSKRPRPGVLYAGLAAVMVSHLS